MIDELQARFLPQFISGARTRIAKIRVDVEARDYGALSTALRELHALVGEAGLLGLHQIIPLARDTEARAHRMHETRDDSDAAALVSALDELGHQIERLQPPTGRGEP